MKKQKLLVEYEFDFDVFGIVSAFKDYKLAWNLNKSLDINLVKQADLNLKFVENELIITNFKYQTENTIIRLLKNKSTESQARDSYFLVPELVKVDYFVTNEPMAEEEGKHMLKVLRDVNGVDYAMIVEIERLKSKENFLF